MEKHGFITRTTYMQLTGRLKNKGLEDLKRMTAKGIITRIGAGNQMHFIKGKEAVPGGK